MQAAEPHAAPDFQRASRHVLPALQVEHVFRWLVTAAALGVFVLVIAMMYELTRQAWPAIDKFGLGFLWSTNWNPPKESFGALPFIAGTLVTSLLALVFGTIVGVGAALFLVELAPPWIRVPVSYMVELLAAIPSVVYGLWGVFLLGPWIQHTAGPFILDYFSWVPFVKGPAMSVGILAAVLILTIMILPTIVAISRDVIAAVPRSQREGILALGATRWEMIRIAVLPYARSGVLGAAILGLARAIGETLAVAMVIGNSTNVPDSIFSPAFTMPSVIALQFREVENDMHSAALLYIGLLLLIITLIVNALARLLVWRVTKGQITTVIE
ncbi:MAG: phosphate ABC transporter permease subunit PstC [Dehalococcoidia bacterium]|nr:MAG: phosphate ABC transporter permease subunit PstC [Dehalococcoidia bacterium]